MNEVTTGHTVKRFGDELGALHQLTLAVDAFSPMPSNRPARWLERRRLLFAAVDILDKKIVTERCCQRGLHCVLRAEAIPLSGLRFNENLVLMIALVYS